MADRVIEHTTIGAAPDAVRAVLLDFTRYPDWAPDLKEVEVLSTDEEGRGTSVRFRAAGFGKSTSYTLSYDYSDPTVLAWTLTEGDITRKLDGFYELLEGDEPGTTDVTYQLEADLIVPIPGFIKRRTQGRIMHTALRELKSRVEQRTP
ncbi:MAG: SRPBCC family protein [Microthrixaceae bacterium]|nr:SRPBCC family protein [Acidimicrobiales bacterium]MCB9404294.1 SRPBCC family protein [Microthrixaceae bacterium]